MTDKAYIVANEQQELQILNNFEEKGFRWRTGDNPTSFVPSEGFNFKENIFPYMLMIANDKILWSVMKELEDKTIVYDGRKEEKMTKKYKVTQEFMDELNEWKQANFNDDFMMVNTDAISDFSEVINNWWYSPLNDRERNNRLIGIIQWLNGEDVFEVETPRKFVVRNDMYDDSEEYWYVKNTKGMSYIVFYVSQATKFDTREEAEEWANSHQVVVEIDEEGNEVKEQ